MAVDFFLQTSRNLDPELKSPEVYLLGNCISGTYLADCFDIIGDRDSSMYVLCKSGTTTEPLLLSRILKAKLIEKYGKDGL